jgi:hypothetical protein
MDGDAVPGTDFDIPHSIADLIRAYQSQFNPLTSLDLSRSESYFESISRFQILLRQLCLIYGTVNDDPPSQFLPVLLSVNFSAANVARLPRFTSAFSDMNILTSLPRFINVLRSDLTFFAFIVFNFLDHSSSQAPLLCFSAIPGVFQCGWCLEEANLWGLFLVHYVERLYSAGVILRLDSVHFLPFRAFLLQKLGTEYLPRVAGAALDRLVYDTRAREERVYFTFDGARLLPIQYIETLKEVARTITRNMRRFFSLVPGSVRGFLARVSEKSLKVGGIELAGAELASFLFVFCALVPVIRKPAFIGVNTDSVFMLDDLAHLLLYSNFKSDGPLPPLFVPLLPMLGNAFSVAALMVDLMNSSHNEGELREAVFVEVVPNYSKLTSFLPLDLVALHTSAILGSQAAAEMLNPAALAQFDYLLGAPPGLDPTRQYDVFAIELTPPEPTAPVIPSPMLPLAVADAIRAFFREVDARLFEAGSITSRIEFCSRSQPSLAGAAVICLAYSSSLPAFLSAEVSHAKSERSRRSSLAMQAGAAHIELMAAIDGTGYLSRRVFCTTSQSIIRHVVRTHLFLEFTQLPGYFKAYVRQASAFEAFCDRVIAKFWSVLALQHSVVHSLRRSAYGTALLDIAYGHVVNRMPMARFVKARRDLQDWIGALLGGGALLSLHRFAEPAPAALKCPAVLARLVEVMSSAFVNGNCSLVLHLAVRTIDTIRSAIPKDADDPEGLLQMAVCWVVVHGDIDRFVNWVYFIRHFFPEGRTLVDLCGGYDVSAWSYFEDVFRSIPGLNEEGDTE